MRSYPIYVKVTSCIYNTIKSYGIRDTGEQKILVGTSKSNSHHFADVAITRRELPDGTTSFALIVDGIIIKQGIFDGKELEIIKHHSQVKHLKAA